MLVLHSGPNLVRVGFLVVTMLAAWWLDELIIVVSSRSAGEDGEDDSG